MTFKINNFHKISFWVSLISVILILLDVGFSLNGSSQSFLSQLYWVALGTGLFSLALRYKKPIKGIKKKILFFDAVLLLLLGTAFLSLFLSQLEASLPLTQSQWVKTTVFFLFIREFIELKINLKRSVLNPVQLFILSFLIVIFLGSLLLMLPRATYHELSYIDALFTSTSAVCVTGLIVVDTATAFTPFGKLILMLLIQVGGLGILTFISYFTYFFQGGTSYENQVVLSFISSSRKIGEVFTTLKSILLITFGVELLSSVLIFFSISSESFNSLSEQIFFSVFHSVSAFCNAGFSTFTNNLYEVDFRFNYYFQLIIIFNFVIGGLGFPIVTNILNYVKYKILTLFNSNKDKHKPWVLNLNSRISLITTVTLSLVAFCIFYLFEYNNTLVEHEGVGKIVTTLFSVTTPRTAGFNTIDFSTLRVPTILFICFLMWVGASPQSTGGGIKTSTFAIAVLNVLSLARGKSRIEIYRREIAGASVKRAYAIMTLSFFILGLGILLISLFDPEKELLKIVFECFSAYGTVGLSLGITAQLSTASKIVIICIMFVGRISMLSLVISFFKHVNYQNYNYPKEEILIN